ncbi:MAG: hypothetical protein JO357_14160 [Hyphomicrobiales bacterium]|nr:hypothetical protein [Hyphomicrobiales bacterium]
MPPEAFRRWPSEKLSAGAADDPAIGGAHEIVDNFKRIGARFRKWAVEAFSQCLEVGRGVHRPIVRFRQMAQRMRACRFLHPFHAASFAA